jgi:hypothetical protein
VTTLTEGTWLRVIMAILIVVSSGLSTGCERAEAVKPVATGPHEVLLRACTHKIIEERSDLQPVADVRRSRSKSPVIALIKVVQFGDAC